MKPIEALMISLVKRYASEFVPAHMRNEFDVAVSDVRQMLFPLNGTDQAIKAAQLSLMR